MPNKSCVVKKKSDIFNSNWTWTKMSIFGPPLHLLLSLQSFQQRWFLTSWGMIFHTVVVFGLTPKDVSRITSNMLLQTQGLEFWPPTPSSGQACDLHTHPLCPHRQKADKSWIAPYMVSESDFEFWFTVLATYLLASSSKQEEVHSVEWGKRRAIRSICPMKHVPWVPVL